MVCARVRARLRVVKEGHVKVCMHLKTLTQTWVNTHRTTSGVFPFELMRRAAECVSAQRHDPCVCVCEAFFMLGQMCYLYVST